MVLEPVRKNNPPAMDKLDNIVQPFFDLTNRFFTILFGSLFNCWNLIISSFYPWIRDVYTLSIGLRNVYPT
ncbi:hypothetical protein IV57_GL001233 [Companilactobacillus kimchiensis]|uniref:Uncharacterized protein n=1 Tax=Companilactobacillus kimchiensis TaxID=993692 RepID=A0A0R2LFQ2_9LACO|nr:hypothetical protein IV57_GL001233 [Companilactobacillus kimchiensis]